MSLAMRNRCKWLTGAIVGAAALGALAIPTKPADAQIYFGVGPGGFDVGVAPPAPYYSPYYYGPHYYHPYYRDRYYYGW